MELKSMQTLMRNQGHVQRIKEPLPLAWALMSRVSHPEDLMLIYNLPAFGSFQPDKASLADEELDAEEKEKIKAASRRQKVHADTQEFLIALARATGRMKKRNIPDEVGASRVLLRDWSYQMLGYYTQAPKLAANAQKVADEIKQRVSTTLPLVLARKEWRKKFQARELRLRPISLVLGPAGKKAPQLKSILKKNAFKKRDLADDAELAEDDGEEQDDEAAQSLSRKDRRLQKKARVVVPSKSKPAASKRNGSKATKSAAAGAAKAASAATGPAPGEKYDFGTFF
ncbi:hypothetical protein [Sporisorium scitamineum]|uniref:Uncharacterized protein n=1 Tax=Sporisorium scitamineum TaxID=49012 RepID=A0A0F7S3L9_9BASI|nr:hypothetical protein [Sporisorium scitamineum]